MEPGKGLYHISLIDDAPGGIYRLFFYVDDAVYYMACAKGIDKHGLVQVLNKLGEEVYAERKKR